MPWFLLVLAGLLEIGWAVGLKYTEGFTRPWPSVITIASMIVSVVLLSMAMKSVPAGTAYAVWSGIGIAGTAVFGAMLLGEPLSAGQGICLALILAGVAGLKILA